MDYEIHTAYGSLDRGAHAELRGIRIALIVIAIEMALLPVVWAVIGTLTLRGLVGLWGGA